MKLEILHVPECPNLLPLLERIAETTDLPVTTRMVESDAAAANLGMAGSPTLLIDGSTRSLRPMSTTAASHVVFTANRTGGSFRYRQSSNSGSRSPRPSYRRRRAKC